MCLWWGVASAIIESRELCITHSCTYDFALIQRWIGHAVPILCRDRGSYGKNTSACK